MKDHLDAISLIMHKEFNQLPLSINRMTVGSGNEVYLVNLKDNGVIVRLNKNNLQIKGSEKYIPLFKSKGIKVPDILASDYSKTLVPYYYQVLSKIEGKDLGLVIHTLSKSQLQDIAKEITSIFKKLKDLPTSGKFGYVYGKGENLLSSWNESMQNTLEIIKVRGKKTALIDADLILTLDRVLSDYSKYFESVSSEFYFDDMSSKNVMIDEGVFRGLVDLDGVAYGDYLETVGRIKASWYGTDYGDFYTNAVMDALELNPFQRNLVTVYAFIHRCYWLSEAGIKFNENTSIDIDSKKVKKDKEIIELIGSEIKYEYVQPFYYLISN